MWSIDYFPKSKEVKSEDADDKIEQDTKENDNPNVDANNDTKPDQTSLEIEIKSEKNEPNEREAAIKRVEELVKQMSLSQEQEERKYLKKIYDRIRVFCCILKFYKFSRLSIKSIFNLKLSTKNAMNSIIGIIDKSEYCRKT